MRAIGQNVRVDPASSTAASTQDGQSADAWPGQHHPLGATWGEEATNFAVFTPEATRVELCLFDPDCAQPVDPPRDRVCDLPDRCRRLGGSL